MRHALLRSLRLVAPLCAALLLSAPSSRAQSTASQRQSGQPLAARPEDAASPPDRSSSTPAPEPAGLAALVAQASSRTEFTFDRSMLQTADQYIENAPEEFRKAAAGIESITVRNFRFAAGGGLDAGEQDGGGAGKGSGQDDGSRRGTAMDTINRSYKGGGWKHLVNKNVQSGGAGLVTDMWLHFDGAEIDHIAVLVRGDKNVTFLNVACWLRPLDLLHLSGHFGIPRMDPNAVMTPAPDGR